MPDKALLKIISGGQTGVDRGALDAALELGVSCGGWCPAGRVAEDGEIPAKYPLCELQESTYGARTLQNVLTADATVIIYFVAAEGGTKQTVSFCISENKPYLLIDANEQDSSCAGKTIAEFIQRREISVVNIAGPRASGHSQAYNYAKASVRVCINKLRLMQLNILNEKNR